MWWSGCLMSIYLNTHLPRPMFSEGSVSTGQEFLNTRLNIRLHWRKRAFQENTHQLDFPVCVWEYMIFLPPWTWQCLTSYPLKSLNLSVVTASPPPPPSPRALSYQYPLPRPLIHPCSLHQFPLECNLQSTGIDQAHTVLISTLG